MKNDFNLPIGHRELNGNNHHPFIPYLFLLRSPLLYDFWPGDGYSGKKICCNPGI